MNLLKNDLAQYIRIGFDNSDLIGSGIEPSLYGNDLELFRDKNTQFVYIYDDMDEVETRISVNHLKNIISNIASKKVEDAFELLELDHFFNTQEDE